MKTRLATIALATAASLLVMAQVAVASPRWCESDPVFAVNGAVVDITTGFEETYLTYATSATFELQVPVNVVAASLTIPSTLPTTTKVSPVLKPYKGTGPIPVVALITISATKKFPIATRVAGTYGEVVSTTPGTSNRTQKISFSLLW